MSDDYDPLVLYDPIMITQEELDALAKLWEEYNLNTDYSVGSNSPPEFSEWYDEDYNRQVKKLRKHEWVPILLIRSTVWSCSHCGAAKETTTNLYCEDNEF